MVIRRELGANGRLLYNILIDASDSTCMQAPSHNRKAIQNPAILIPTSENQKIDPWVCAGIPKKIKINSNLNHHYTFDNFIEGECNRLARSAGYAIADNPGGNAFNPMFVYSATGLGKTHLLHSIGIKIKENFPDKTVLYVSSEDFLRQFIASVKNQTVNDFNYFYQSIDVLLMDDIHNFAGKAATQEQLFHLFNYLHQNNKQIVLTSDKSPLEMEDIEPRLLSRFKWGLSAQLTPPDAETRVQIIKSKIMDDGGIVIPDDVVEYIAYRISNNVREIEGVLKTILAESILSKRTITLDLVRGIIDQIATNTNKEVSIDYIKSVVCDHFNISVNDINSNTRKREIVQARQLVMYFSKEYTQSSLAKIGKLCGNKDHATVLHAHRTVKNQCDTNKKYKLQVQDLEKKLKC
ncbi:chromosomal replication initiator protein DnaA [Bacteroidia bacterium]|nr:chromosomal replication initiator protein DnaA [Bacteroidia bacterium]